MIHSSISVSIRSRTKVLLRRSLFFLALCIGICIALLVVATMGHLQVPAPTGPHAVGRLKLEWTDSSREEVTTPASGDKREIIAEVWYPAKANTGNPAPYIPDLDKIGDGLVQSGELNNFEIWGLRYVRDHSRTGAVMESTTTHPVVILSPGNATNVEFYASYAEDLASNGYIVFGIDHPYDVAAVALANGSIAVYMPHDGMGLEGVAQRVDERVADVRFLLDRLQEVDANDPTLAHHLDLSQIGVIGHSLGGLTASEACAADARLKACANIDGLQPGGGAYSVRASEKIPEQPFLFLTKETNLQAPLQAQLASNKNLTQVVIARASHGDFADGPLFAPSLNPFRRNVDAVMNTTRTVVREFFEKYLYRKQPIS
jgi:dienelactone hydrolase